MFIQQHPILAEALMLLWVKSVRLAGTAQMLALRQ